MTCTNSVRIVSAILSSLALAGLVGAAQARSSAADQQAVAHRGDVRDLPPPLRDRLVELAGRPHSYLPLTAFAEASSPSLLTQYYLLDTRDFQPNVFTSRVAGINDRAIPTGTGANGGLATIGSVRVVLEPKPGLPTNPNDVRAFIDVFTDVSGLFVINNESGWYEGWLIRDVRVPPIAPAKPDGSAQFGTMTAADAVAIAAMGSGNNVSGHIFSTDGNAVHFPAANDRFPELQSNVVPFPVSIGDFNAQQQSDIHAYWEFNPGTNWTFPHLELPGTGGLPGTFAGGLQYAPQFQSLVPGSGPGVGGHINSSQQYGDNPDNPRDPDRTEASDPSQRETRNRFIPSNLTEELLLDVFVRVTSFEPGVGLPQRLLDAYAIEVARVDQNNDGVISFVEADVNGTSDGLPNTRLYLPVTAFNRFAITRELNDGFLAPRFAPSQRAYVLGGAVTLAGPGIPASIPQDADNRSLPPPPAQPEALVDPSRARLQFAGANPSTNGGRIDFFLPRSGQARLEIFNVNGGLVRTLLRGDVEAGAGSVVWDGRAESGTTAGAGVYFATLSGVGERVSQKLIVTQ